MTVFFCHPRAEGIARLVRGWLLLSAVFHAGAVASAGAETKPAAEAKAPRVLPDFGVLLNDDGDFSARGETPAESVRLLQAGVDSLAGTNVRTLVWCVGAGSDVLYYPTKVASMVGWRASDPNVVPQEQHKRAREMILAGFEPPRIAGTRAREAGLRFVPTFRMNDVHFTGSKRDPLTSALTGEFWLQNKDRLTFAGSETGAAARNGLANLLDFAHAEVRAYRLGVIMEILDRYGEICDGIQLDFTRHYRYFRDGTGERNAHLITEMMEKVRARLDELSRSNHRNYCLFIRLPPTMEDYRWAGLDVDDWLRRRLVDVISVSHNYSISLNIPVAGLARRVHDAGAQLYISVFPRTADTNPHPFVAEPSSQHYANYGVYTSEAARLQATSGPLMRAAVFNYKSMGVDGFEMFNIRIPMDDYKFEIQQILAGGENLAKGDRLYAITQGSGTPRGGSSPRQVPRRLKSGVREQFSLLMGENPADIASAKAYCGLRLGLKQVSATDTMEVTVNGHEIWRGRLESRLLALPRAEADAGVGPPLAQAYLQLQISDSRVLRAGSNEIVVKALPEDAKRIVELVDVQLGVVNSAGK